MNSHLVKTQTTNSLLKGPQRTSGLPSPLLQLTGHAKAVTTCGFSPTGEFFASGSADHRIFLWNTRDCRNYGVLQHKASILELQYMSQSQSQSQGDRLITATADNLVHLWDTRTGERLRKGKRHRQAVNACCPLGDYLFVSASDDGFVMVWDAREKEPVSVIENPGKWPMTSIAASPDGNTLYGGCLDNEIKCWDLRTLGLTQSLCGHANAITGLSISPRTGSYLASASLDNTLRLWDLRPYCKLSNRCERVLVNGTRQNLEKQLVRPGWSQDEELVGCGGMDGGVTLWQRRSGMAKLRLPGHRGAVTQCCFNPREPMVLSSSVDKTLFIGEI